MKRKPKPKTFKDVVKFFGNVATTAKELGISHQSVYFYVSGARKVNPIVAAKVDLLTEGKICRKDFFPKTAHIIWAEFNDAK